MSYAVDCEKLRAILTAKAKYRLAESQVKNLNPIGTVTQNHFIDGTIEEQCSDSRKFDMIFAADGPNSKCRSRLISGISSDEAYQGSWSFT